MQGRVAASLAVAMLTAGTFVSSAWGDAEAELDSIVVTATRVAEVEPRPARIHRPRRSREIAAGQLKVNLAESLITVPGVSIQSRQNYAQDLQLSVRGFGARSSFGVRGLRLYSDGIPGTMPDGQGQFSQFDLGSADHIEVLRGPFSALYGNSSGGVIAVFTEDGQPEARQHTWSGGVRHLQHSALRPQGRRRRRRGQLYRRRGALSDRWIPIP